KNALTFQPGRNVKNVSDEKSLLLLALRRLLFVERGDIDRLAGGHRALGEQLRRPRAAALGLVLGADGLLGLRNRGLDAGRLRGVALGLLVGLRGSDRVLGHDRLLGPYRAASGMSSRLAGWTPVIDGPPPFGGSGVRPSGTTGPSASGL